MEPWVRIRSGTVRYRGKASGQLPVSLQFRSFGVLANGHAAAVFTAESGGRNLEAWIAPDHRTGIPRVVHALGGINKAADVCFVAA